MEQKAELGAKTRSRKQKDLTMPELREEWRSWLTEEEREALGRIADRIGGEPLDYDSSSGRHAVSLASDHCFERQSVVPERVLLAESLKRAVGNAKVRDVEQAFAAEPFLARQRNGRRMLTTPEVLSEERAMLRFAREGRGTRRPFARGPHSLRRTWLNAGQRKAVEHVLQSRDRVILIRGAAGVGKTSMMQEAVDAIEASGTRVFTFAPSARASRGVLQEQGFAGAETVARLLLDEKLQQSVKGQAIWIDEAGLLGTRTMSRVFHLADQLDARVILSGDRRQHGSVERGAALRLLEDQAGLVPAEIKEIQRQQARYKQAVLDLSEERVTQGFQTLDDLGWIREVDDDQRAVTLAADYIASVAAGESALVVSPTHREAESITAAIRQGLREQGLLAEEEHTVRTLHRLDLTAGERRDPVNYSPGDVLIFHQNAKGFTKGERLTLGDEPPPVSQADRFQVFQPGELTVAAGDVLRITQNGHTADGRRRLSNGDLLQVTGFDAHGDIETREGKTIGREFGHLAHGFCMTSHQSQGSDVDRVFIGQSAMSFPASSREQFYVSVSRGRKQAVVYTDHKVDLLDAVRRSDERLSATELLHTAAAAERVAILTHREREAFDRSSWHLAHARREELSHDR